MTLVMSACGQSEPQGRRVFFIQPADGATVKSPVRLEFGAADFYGWSEDKARQYGVPERTDFGAFIREKRKALGA